MKEQNTLHAHHCFRCSYTWWPRQRKSPRRCARCKSPYWNRPRRKGVQPADGVAKPPFAIASPDTGSAIAATSIQPPRPVQTPKQEPDLSFHRGLAVLHQMKAEKASWAQMAERMQQEFKVQLDKDQLKGLVRQ